MRRAARAAGGGGLRLALAVAFLIGGMSALLVRKPFILDASGADPVKVEKQKSATEQFLFAVESGTEAAWKSVGKYFPDDPYVARADQQLARLYLLNDRNDDALKLFEQFVNYYGNGDPKYRAFGFAGECLVYYIKANQKETPAAARELDQINSARDARELLEICKGAEPDKLAGMLDRQMVRAVSNGLKTNNPKESAAWEQWRTAHFPDDSNAATQN